MKDRILQLVEDKNLTLGAFADEIGVERSTMSHIKAERSKPSLDVAQKILERYPEVNSDWLILGKGPIYRQKTNSREPNLFDDFELIASSTAQNEQKSEQKTVTAAAQSTQNSAPTAQNVISAPAPAPATIKQRCISRVILFYDDGTFEEVIRS